MTLERQISLISPLTAAVGTPHPEHGEKTLRVKGRRSTAMAAFNLQYAQSYTYYPPHFSGLGMIMGKRPI